MWDARRMRAAGTAASRTPSSHTTAKVPSWLARWMRPLCQPRRCFTWAVTYAPTRTRRDATKALSPCMSPTSAASRARTSRSAEMPAAAEAEASSASPTATAGGRSSNTDAQRRAATTSVSGTGGSSMSSPSVAVVPAPSPAPPSASVASPAPLPAPGVAMDTSDSVLAFTAAARARTPWLWSRTAAASATNARTSAITASSTRLTKPPRASVCWRVRHATVSASHVASPRSYTMVGAGDAGGVATGTGPILVLPVDDRSENRRA